jgi:hypothetical protein
MTIKDTKTEQNQTLANVPIVFWRRFKTKCVSKGITMTQGFMEAATLWLERD